MTEINNRLLNLINEGKNINQIATTLELSNKQIYQRLNQLKQNGYFMDREYSLKGDIKYKLIKSFITEEKNIEIKMNNSNYLRTVLISDLHIGCEKQRLDCLNQVYEYCIKNGIHIIINAGDLINGKLGSSWGVNNIIDNYEDQIKYLLKNYPFDKNILNFCCLGNHDFDALEHEGINLETILYNNRHDIIPLGFGEGFIKVKDEYIRVYHKIEQCETIDPMAYFTIKGHTHKMEIQKSSVVTIDIPPLSDLLFEQNFVPSALDMTIVFNNEQFNNLNLKQLSFYNNNVYTVNETSLLIRRNKSDANTNNTSHNNNPKTLKLNKYKNKHVW